MAILSSPFLFFLATAARHFRSDTPLGLEERQSSRQHCGSAGAGRAIARFNFDPAGRGEGTFGQPARASSQRRLAGPGTEMEGGAGRGQAISSPAGRILGRAWRPALGLAVAWPSREAITWLQRGSGPDGRRTRNEGQQANDDKVWASAGRAGRAGNPIGVAAAALCRADARIHPDDMKVSRCRDEGGAGWDTHHFLAPTPRHATPGQGSVIKTDELSTNSSRKRDWNNPVTPRAAAVTRPC